MGVVSGGEPSNGTTVMFNIATRNGYGPKTEAVTGMEICWLAVARKSPATKLTDGVLVMEMGLGLEPVAGTPLPPDATLAAPEINTLGTICATRPETPCATSLVQK